MENILLAVVIGLAVWLFMRNARMMRERRRRQAPPGPGGGGEDAPPQKSMPRMGTPGTISRQQMAALKENDFEPDRGWSHEEAQLILDSVTYLRATIRMVTGETGAPIEVQNNILAFILGEEVLRDSVLDWGLNRTRDEEDAGENVELPQDETFERIAGHVHQLWQDN
jgi:hypothetical protein